MRRIRVFASYRNLSADAVEGLDVVIVDVLRATTTIVFAVSQGASVLPLAGVDEALERGRELGDKAIVVGERMGQQLAGFHCNNSPTELAAFDLKRKTVVLTTTNGTQAVAASKPARRIFAAALTNAPALGEFLCKKGTLERDLAIICAGRNTGAIAFEDLLGAGAVVSAVEKAAKRGADLWLADGARVAREIFRRERARLHAAVRGSDAGRDLMKHGGRADIAVASAHGTVEAVARLRGGMFVTA
ncbi:MAG: 2-phosphosulfolactate phosphatase [Myxococcales bacterium]|nr:2-phosphosulfolactate phosphatase [Myxococcales bacterium]